MKYLRTFYQRLRDFRHKKKLTLEDIATFCQVDVTVVAGWENPIESQRCFPSIDNLFDLCVKTGVSLDALLDFNQNEKNNPQLDLPGFEVGEDGDLDTVIERLTKVMEEALPDSTERLLLKRFRASDEDKKRFILQLMNSGE
ncbi:helix-turn-helix domain-containing protein [Hahella sp. HN01]|uniref:helix-turn-helix domain-containing protein n=1 Tax=Hahella sp. HN01 TaxID=2847262 RepID=UPI001C1F157A|nr:helix-turn-helix transcriptional regulator [Hahella sp. HN01]MBU6952343.1 helix-turn-helix domain-containing protein [Hahella sp. HN01]